MPKHTSSSSLMTLFVESFSPLLSNQLSLSQYPVHFYQTRSSLLQWLIQISNKLFLSNETTHRAITIFDQYICASPHLQITNKEMKLTLVSCLSLASKFHEVNANYNVFLTQNLLHNDNLTAEDLHTKEIEVLKRINYNINTANVYTFNSILMSICERVIRDDKVKAKFVYVNTTLLQRYILSKDALQLSPINSAMYVINCTLSTFNESDIDKNNIVNSILKIRH